MNVDTRRGFLKGTVWMGLAAAAAGCRSERMGFGTGGPKDDKGARLLFLGTSHGAVRPTRFCTCTMLQYGKRIYFSGDLSSAYDLPLDPFKDGQKVDVLVSELVHYPLKCAVKRLAGLPIGKVLFHHYGDGWEDGQPGRDERFENFRRQLGIPAEIVTDLDIRHVGDQSVGF